MSDSTKAVLTTFVKTFIVAMLAQFIAMGSDIFAVDKGGWKSILSAGVAAVVMFGYNYLSSSFPLYGNKPSDKVIDAPPGE